MGEVRPVLLGSVVNLVPRKEVTDMTFTEAIRNVYSHYATFKGRASRSEFWKFVIFVAIVTIVLYLPLIATGGSTGDAGSGLSTLVTVSLLAGGIFTLVTLLPYLSVLVRRLHDTNRSGWWYWIALVPFVGEHVAAHER
jgi:uncharacterized membrane protein YhaH (DUF805 family)